MLRKTKIKYYLSPFFLSKYYINRDLRDITEKYKFSGDLLDFGCGSKPYEALFEKVNYYGIDFENYSVNNGFKLNKPDYFFKKSYLQNFKLDFRPETFNVVTSFQVLEHHSDPHMMISEIFRITKKNGFILLTFPFLGGIHEEPNDYQRYTKYGFVEMFKKYDCEILEIREQGSLFSTISILLNEYINNFAGKNKITFIFTLLIYFPFLLFQYLSLILDKVFRSNKIFFNYLVLVRKK